MKAATLRLLDILDRETRLHAALRDLLQDEERRLRAGEHPYSAEALARKDDLVGEIRAAESARRAEVRSITGREDTRLRELAGAYAGELGAARSGLIGVLGEVATAARRVEALVSGRLTRLHLALDLVRDALGAGPQYTPGARLVRSALPVLDGKA